MKASRKPGFRVSGPIAILAPFGTQFLDGAIYIVNHQTDVLQSVMGEVSTGMVTWPRNLSQLRGDSLPHARPRSMTARVTIGSMDDTGVSFCTQGRPPKYFT